MNKKFLISGSIRRKMLSYLWQKKTDDDLFGTLEHQRLWAHHLGHLNYCKLTFSARPQHVTVSTLWACPYHKEKWVHEYFLPCLLFSALFWPFILHGAVAARQGVLLHDVFTFSEVGWFDSTFHKLFSFRLSVSCHARALAALILSQVRAKLQLCCKFLLKGERIQWIICTCQ